MSIMIKRAIITEMIVKGLALYKIHATGGVMYPFAVNMLMGCDIPIMDIIVVIIMMLVKIIWNRKMFAVLCKPY